MLATAVLVLALLGGVTWHRAASPVQPASGPVGLPDRVWDPSPWLPSTDRPGPAGRARPWPRGAAGPARAPALVGDLGDHGEVRLPRRPAGRRAGRRGRPGPLAGRPAHRLLADRQRPPARPTPSPGRSPVSAVYDTETGGVSPALDPDRARAHAGLPQPGPTPTPWSSRRDRYVGGDDASDDGPVELAVLGTDDGRGRWGGARPVPDGVAPGTCSRERRTAGSLVDTRLLHGPGARIA